MIEPTARRTATAIVAEVCRRHKITLRALRQARGRQAKRARREAIVELRTVPTLAGRRRTRRAIAEFVGCNLTTVQYWTLPVTRAGKQAGAVERHRRYRQRVGYKTVRGRRHAENRKRRKAMVEGGQNGVHPSPSICPPDLSPWRERVE